MIFQRLVKPYSLFVSCATMFCLSVLSPAYPVKVTNFGKPAGMGDYNQQRIGNKVIKYLSVKIIQNHKASVIFDQTTYSDTGMPISDDFTSGSGGHHVHYTVRYESNRAIVSGTNNGKNINHSYPLPAGVSDTNPSNIWFIFKQPKLNQIVIASIFDTNTMKWVTHTITYRGDETIHVNGSSILTHRIFDQEPGGNQELWLSSTGALVRFVSGNLTIEKG